MELKIGDIFYIFSDNKYFVYKLVRKDDQTQIHHVLVYKPFDVEPVNVNIKDLEILAKHLPIDNPKNYKIIANVDVLPEELEGFYEFLKLTDFARYLEESGKTIEEVVNSANSFFLKADNAYKAENFREAIENYTLALQVYPLFFESIDRRAFAKMALGEYLDAIKDFEFSLMINPNSVIAEFAIGECFFKLGDFQKAVEQFEHTLKLFPEDDLTVEWLEKSKRELARVLSI